MRNGEDHILDPFQPSVAFDIETSHLIYTANQMTGFYMKCNAGQRSFEIFAFIRSLYQVLLMYSQKLIAFYKRIELRSYHA